MYKPQRLHPLAILDFLVSKVYSLVQMLLPLLVIAVAKEEIRHWLLPVIPILAVLFVVYGILYWLRYVFYIQGQELRLEYGVLVRKKRFIPFERIQTVQISAGVMQRLFGLVKIQVETAGGGSKAEFVLTALSRDTAEELQQILGTGGKRAEEAERELEGIEYKLSARSLLLLASTSNGIGVMLGGMLAITSQLDDLLSEINVWDKIGTYAEHLAAGKISLIILAVLLLIMLAWLLSLMGTILRYGNFQLRREGDSIHVHRGLLEKQQISIPIKRIQAIKVVEGLLRQPLGMVSVQVVSISNTDAKSQANIIFPLLPRAELAELLDKVAPEFSTTLNLEKLPSRSRNRYLLINVIPVLIIAILCTIYLPWGYISWVLIFLAAGLGNRQYLDAGYQVIDNKLLIRSRILSRVTMIIPRHRIQSLHVSQNPLQLRSDLSNLWIEVASANLATTVKLKGMDKEKSKNIMDWFASN